MPDPGEIISETLAAVRASVLPYRERLASRLEDLAATFGEDYEGATVSIGFLVEFFSACPIREYTALTLTPAGDCFVEWSLAQDKKVSIEFCADGTVRFVMTRPNPRHRERTELMTGITTADALLEPTADYPVLTSLAA